MNSPIEQREKKIAAAAKARSLIADMGKTTNLEARATALHDRVSEGIKSICADGACFDGKQTETLTEMAVHLALLFDGDMQPPKGFAGQLRRDWGKMGATTKVVFVGGVVTLLANAGGVISNSYNWFNSVPAAAVEQSASEDSAGALPSSD
ncbi:hypothetical protein R2G56_08395 [Nitratireductor aquimarinus]|uniref:Uncharacterized protein n=1 Tax=Nitratireductor aquimarinus TaxID=889300 RepID=A0ABU4AJ85_9HYPH|nr:hypothetical protein [Nitratireductor aquimarinus]MDV6226303.1 hypothetical protein [Nitratireductor aquimarinus]